MAPAKKKVTTKTFSQPPLITTFMKSPKLNEEKDNKIEDNDGKHQQKRLRKTADTEAKATDLTEEVGSLEGSDSEEEEENVEKRQKTVDGEAETSVDFAELDSKPHYIGGHESIAGGVHKALIESRRIGSSACAFFLRPPKSFHIKPLTEETVVQWHKTVRETQFKLENIVVHAPYLLNIGSPKDEALERSRSVLYDDLERCDRLGIKYYNIHPGSTLNQISVENCCRSIAESVNMGLKKTKSVVLLLENMAGQGNWVGSKFQELGKIIEMVEDKTRIGVCLDTCHAFAYGYGLNTQAGFKRLLDDFEKYIGLKYLKAVHLNDSKGACGDHKDRHEDIGKGVIGKAGFKLFMNEPAFRGLPLILETPGGHYDKEITLLHSMVNK